MNIGQGIGQSLGYYHFEEHSPGMVFWHPEGASIYNSVQNYIRYEHRIHGYMEVKTPTLLNKSLWETSGHWFKFKENMFVVEGDEDMDTMALRPMSCPGAIELYKKQLRSYNEFPIRYFEFGNVFRNESSGSLADIKRTRNFTQDDSHIFCLKEQIIDEAKNYITMLRDVYTHFGFDQITVKLSTRPVKRAGSDAVWDLAEQKLKDACDAMGMAYEIQEGEGAFYGPKLEFTLLDALDRPWQCGTFQLDFVLPTRFDLYYQNDKSQRVHSTENQDDGVVLIHHAVFGSLERWIGILLESYEGGLPFDYSPVQFVVCSISEKSEEWAREVHKWLVKNYRAELDINAEKITSKIKKHSLRKPCFIIIIGEKEQQDKTINVRVRGETATKTVFFNDVQVGELISNFKNT